MDLHSGYPYWLVKNGLLADYPALTHNLPAEEVVIIGSGISGALAAHSLCAAGLRCTMVDKRIASSGSTWASTAQVNYELDAWLYELADWYGEEYAVKVYQANLASVERVKEIAAEAGMPDVVEPKASLYLASDRRGARSLQKELDIRKRNGFPVEMLDAAQLKAQYGFDRKCALYHNRAAQLDSYRLTIGLLEHNIKKGGLTVYTRTDVKEMQPDKDGVTLRTENGFTIRARHAVCAPGYEGAQFLPKKTMDLNSTYALVTQPLPEGQLWKDRCLIWETRRPYFYLRTTADGRIMMGGEDESFHDAKRRDKLLDKKTKALLRTANDLFPHLHLTADFYWCGTFGETGDSLPNIGRYPGTDNVYFALGYGGNGTSFSVIASEVIRNLILGKPDERIELFRFGRNHA